MSNEPNENNNDSQEPQEEQSASTKLQRRRRIEDIAEEKRLRAEMDEYELI